MTHGRWEKFRKTLALDIGTPSTGSANILADWQRASANEGSITINGVDLSKVGPLYNNFATQEDLSAFFRQAILKDMKEPIKEGIIDYLKQTFHQGGFQSPVSSAIAVSMKQKMSIMQWQGIGEERKEVEVEMMIPVFTANPEKILHIETTPTGFKLQEIATAKKIMVPSTDYQQKYQIDPLDPTLKPEAGHEYVYKAQGTIDLNFNHFDNNKQPVVTVESSSINYGNSTVEKVLDKRNMGQIIIDFFKHVFGLNKVEMSTPTNVDANTKPAISENNPTNENTPKP